jgi:arsenate reductase (glutaredoxin)
MNIQIYVSKKNFDVQKAERFFKERRIPYQMVDLSRHPLGARELQLFSQKLTAGALVDREDKKVKEHPVCYAPNDDVILAELIQKPALMRSPIVRNGTKVTIGAAEDEWLSWLNG